MRNFSLRSLFALVAVTTILGITMPVRSQSRPSSTPNKTTNTRTSVEISRPQQPEISSGKKTSVVKMFEDIAIAPNFVPTVVELRGISGGGTETQAKSGRKVTETGECIGFIDAEPDHKITLTQPFNYLKMQVRSSGDTVLLVRGPGGSWCSDDVRDRNPEIAGDWLEGTYEVWIGSYEENASFPYLLELSEQP
ncbi:hypothetical protein [Pseudanabaena mucicola]|uniref:Uncharacterized protein n=1 Tax=Pseudanabaena mucicola FACHB-723 TaxID=2692860 RepID=A0ABR8A086_9CYAN|nr:hypothetical protein [Pseudanabaena mucicola]MBD2189632.1 hypothetical protein [Pseudanabaena mucicola FACHB-723]